jgi:ATP-binding protein involved in chromosome partitioning
MSDPRLSIISRRLSGVKKVIAVSSGKGGVGKSMIASTLALCLRARNHRVGLLDLDFTSPSTHIILGIEGLYPKEEKGIIPPMAHDLRYLSITHYSLDKPTPLRGADVSNAIVELMAITRWGNLDYLLIDMPPGIGDATLDMIRLVKGINFLIVTTPSRVAYETVSKLLALLRRLDIPILGVVENMIMNPSPHIREQVEGDGLAYLGAIEHDPKLEDAIGDIKELSSARFYSSVSKLASVLE